MSNVPIYHITALDNLDNIVACSGLQSNKQLSKTNQAYTNIAYDHIQNRRASHIVEHGPGGTLHDYIPFYFAPRSPMLYAIYKGKVENYQDKQDRLIYLVSDTDSVRAYQLPFVFTDGHATVAYTRFFDDTDYLGEIDWQIMKEKFWSNTAEDNDRKRRRSAEFLVYNFFPWQCVREIGVLDQRIRKAVWQVIEQQFHQPSVKSQPSWYY